MRTKSLLDWPCRKCGRANMCHAVFVTIKGDNFTSYEAQYPRDDGIPLVWQSDHATELCDNLEYLEWKSRSKE
jgi:hypothetical protein